MFILLNLFGWTYWLATFLGNSMGAVVSYLLNRSFTFNSNVTGSKSIPMFLLVILSCYGFSYFTGEVVADSIHFSSEVLSYISKDEVAILVGTVLYTITNYLGQKNFVFRRIVEE
jgi:putative flippase GtrA